MTPFQCKQHTITSSHAEQSGEFATHKKPRFYQSQIHTCILLKVESLLVENAHKNMKASEDEITAHP
jgi:hypothetical protein